MIPTLSGFMRFYIVGLNQTLAHPKGACNLTLLTAHNKFMSCFFNQPLPALPYLLLYSIFIIQFFSGFVIFPRTVVEFEIFLELLIESQKILNNE